MAAIESTGGATRAHHSKELLQQIATVANEADALCYRAQDGQSTALSEQLRDMVCRIGWMADLALTKLGAAPMVGGPEEWLLPPSYHWAPGTERRVRHDAPREAARD